MKTAVPPQTKRLLLRELQPSDVEAIFDLLSDPEAMRYFPRTYTREEAAGWIERNQQRGAIFGYSLWAVMERASGEVLGDCGPSWHEIDDELQLEIGYHFRRRYWGQGFATEAARSVMEWVFTNLPVEHVISLIRPENGPSRRVAERNGLAVADSTMFRGMEHLVYRMERERWESIQGAQQP